MPIYEYRCQDCDEVFEVFQKMSDPPPSAHRCGGKNLTRLLSNTSFRLVGTGWYATDYANKPTPQKEGAGAAEKAKPVAKAPTEKSAPQGDFKQSKASSNGKDAS